MIGWYGKNRHYNVHEHPNCTKTYETPFDDDLLCCGTPGYIPARLYNEEIDTKYNIPRVIFTTWANRRIGRSMYTSLLTLIYITTQSWNLYSSTTRMLIRSCVEMIMTWQNIITKMLNLQYQHSVEYNRVQCVQIYALYKTMVEYV